MSATLRPLDRPGHPDAVVALAWEDQGWTIFGRKL